MTPLAQRIVKELTLPKKRRLFDDRCNLAHKLTNDAHCFEVSEVMDLAIDLGGQIHRELVDEETGRHKEAKIRTAQLTFLPAPVTWLEWTDGAKRMGCLLTSFEHGGFAIVDWAMSEPFRSSDNTFNVKDHPKYTDDNAVFPWSGVLELDSVLELGMWKAIVMPGRSRAENVGFSVKLWALLALINTPRIIGRRQHAPHVGLERALLRNKELVGRFPLHAWTEIKLEVRAPRVDEDGLEESHLTGMRAFHFCRAHLRIRRGMLEFVRAHWRGDPALGIKQSRYKVVPAI